MKKTWKAGVFIVAGVAVAYAGGAYYAGRMIAKEVGNYVQILAPNDEIYVRALQYEPGIFSGTLTYDLVWRPLPGNPLRSAWMELSDGESPELRLTGSLPVQHGPWAGGPYLARATEQLALPESLRGMLPQYPGQKPWLTLEATVNYARELTVDAKVIDYVGRIVDPTEGFLFEANLTGLGARVVVPEGASQFAVDARLGQLGIDGRETQVGLRELALKMTQTVEAHPVAKGEVTLQSIRFADASSQPVRGEMGPVRAEFDLKREWSKLWSGTSSMILSGAELSTPDGDGQVGKVTVSSKVEREKDKLNGHMLLNLAEWRFAGVALPPLVFETSYRDVDGAALDTIVTVADQAMDQETEVLSDAAWGHLEAAGRRLLAGGPSFSIDRLALSVAAPDDIRMNLSASFPVGTTWTGQYDDAVLSVLKALKLSAGAYISRAALEPLMSRLLSMQQIEGGKPAADPSAYAEQARQMIDTWLPTLQEQPYWVIDDEAIRFDGKMENGQILINGKEIEGAGSVEDLAMLGAILWGNFGGMSDDDDDDVAEPAVTPDVTEPAAYETLVLESNFQPDPQRVRLVAGGSDHLSGELGNDCIGYIDASRPDVEVQYTAGDFSLFFSVRSRADTALVISMPDGSWICNDDGFSDNLDPLVEVFDPESGSYRVWVSTLSDEQARATLSISEADPSRP